MPRACPVVVHAGCYSGLPLRGDATGLSRGPSRWLLQRASSSRGCHGLVPWSFTLAATAVCVSASSLLPFSPWFVSCQSRPRTCTLLCRNFTCLIQEKET